MHELLSRLDNDDVLAICGMLVGVVAILGGISVAITKVMSSHYRKSQVNEMEATLKMEMIQRGMSAGAIKQVLEARMSSSKPVWRDVLEGMASGHHRRASGKEYTNS
jgi:hypothetical protein